MEEPKAIGRPKIPFNQEIADELCHITATTTDGIQKIVDAHPHWPNKAVIYGWMLSNPAFSTQYESAKLVQANILAQEAMEIAADGSKDFYVSDGNTKFSAEHVQRSKLIIDTIKWQAGRLWPKKWGKQAEEQAATKEDINDLKAEMKKHISKYDKDY